MMHVVKLYGTLELLEPGKGSLITVLVRLGLAQWLTCHWLVHVYLERGNYEKKKKKKN